jgi:hypothetical protein
LRRFAQSLQRRCGRRMARRTDAGGQQAPSQAHHSGIAQRLSPRYSCHRSRSGRASITARIHYNTDYMDLARDYFRFSPSRRGNHAQGCASARRGRRPLPDGGSDVMIRIAPDVRSPRCRRRGRWRQVPCRSAEHKSDRPDRKRVLPRGSAVEAEALTAHPAGRCPCQKPAADRLEGSG